MRRGLLCMVLLGVLTGSSPALADSYNYLGFLMLHSEEGPFRYHLDDRLERPAGLELVQVETALKATYDTWAKSLRDAGCAPPAFEYAGRIGSQTADVRSPYDRFNVGAVWISSRTDPYYDFALAGGKAAVSTIPLAYGGYLYQCDIYLNGTGDFRWSTLATTPEGHLDLQSFLLREVGYCLGLGKVSEWNAVMHWNLPAGVSRRQLTVHDVAQACALYPRAGSKVGAFCTVAGTCDEGLTCVSTEGVNGGTVRVCAKGCTGTNNGECPDPFVCKPSTLVADSEYACLPAAGDYVTLTGKACGDASECGSARAFCQEPLTLPSKGTAWVGGYCSERCTEGGDECGSSAICARVDETRRWCLSRCRPGTGDCRPGYACSPLPEGNACVPACYTDSDCGTDHACRTCDRVCVRKQKPGITIGEQCTVDADCGTNQVCLHPNGHPQGLCAQPCETAACACPGGTTCQPVGANGAALCVRTCTQDTCGPGLQCAPFPDGSTGCLPLCRDHVDCPGGSTCGSDGRCVSSSASPDAGVCLLCGGADGGSSLLDAGVGTPDGGTGPGPSGPGCGCQGSSASAPGFLGALGLLLVAGRRRRCQRL